jgi:DNA mismatch repair protein MutL
VREALGRFNIIPSLDFENEALIDIPVRSSSGMMPEPPSIEINTQYNPFAGEERGQRSGVIERFERENPGNWERLYSGIEKDEKISGQPDKFNENQRGFFQIKNKYILCPVKSGLMMIDQKRAHERILFEKFMNRPGSKSSAGQANMFPVTVEMSPGDYLLLKEIEDDINMLGFDFRHLGNNVISINSQPAENGSANPGETLKTVLEVFKNTEADPATGNKEKVASAMARASAIPYGKTLTQNEMGNLFDSLFACSSPNYSPGGKPVINIITLEELDKRFK